jgi:hypothetical protein
MMISPVVDTNKMAVARPSPLNGARLTSQLLKTKQSSYIHLGLGLGLKILLCFANYSRFTLTIFSLLDACLAQELLELLGNEKASV